MMRQPLQCQSPLSLAIALIGSATARQITGTLERYSPFQQTVRLTDRRSGETAELRIARAATAASPFQVMIAAVTTRRMRRQVTTLVRGFVRETQAPLTLVLASQAA